MATFSYTPDYPATKIKRPNVTTVKFGDGYEQRFTKGINTTPENWNLVFEQREQADADAIEAFLDARGGTESFDWETPDGGTIKVKCQEWPKRREKGNRFSFNLLFEEVFEP